jgi:uncharacterized membrane protein
LQQAERRALAQLHVCAPPWGFTAVLGKLITLPASNLVVWRMALVTLMLAAIPDVWRGLASMTGRSIGTYAGIGVVLALHWLTFYGAIKLADASVAASCVALGSIFTAALEPRLTGRPYEPREFSFGSGPQCRVRCWWPAHSGRHAARARHRYPLGVPHGLAVVVKQAARRCR